MNKSNIQSTEGSNYVQVKNERKLRKLGIESCPKVVFTPNFSQQWFGKSCCITNYKKIFPSQNFPLIAKIVYTPEIYQIINRLINSAENLTNVIIKNDQNQIADYSKMEI